MGNAPNPFRDATTIAFQLDAPADVELAVYNLLGQQVARRLYTSRPAGENTIQWDGRTAEGAALSSGVYVYRLITGNRALTGRFTLVR
jgi:flagellar hook assembly protein FlgD